MKLTNFTFVNDTQKIMFYVVISLLPATLYKAFSFGWLGFFALATLTSTALVTEKLSAKMLNIKSDIANFSSVITALLLFLSLSCNLTLFIYFLASLSAILIGKMVYGGLAKNVFNPAMVGWCFVMVSFPQFLSKHIDYTTTLNFIESIKLFIYGVNIDSFTSATPLTQYKDTGIFAANNNTLIINLLILLGGLFMLYKKLITAIFPLSFLLGIALSLVTFNYNIAESITLFALYGPIALTAFYIITDPVSSPSLKRSQFIYSFSIGFIAIIIASQGNYPIGIAFAVLFVNAFNFILDKQLSKQGTSK